MRAIRRVIEVCIARHVSSMLNRLSLGAEVCVRWPQLRSARVIRCEIKAPSAATAMVDAVVVDMMKIFRVLRVLRVLRELWQRLPRRTRVAPETRHWF